MEPYVPTVPPAGKKKIPTWALVLLIVGAALLLFCCIGTAWFTVTGGSDTAVSRTITPDGPERPGRSVELEPADRQTPAAEPTQGPTAEPTPELTAAQEQAIGMANSYLNYMSFSREGLIEQLQYEGFDTDDAEFAVDHIEVDWDEQAVESAESYLEFMNFSREGLIEQLMFEGFTREQAEHGVDGAGL